VRGGELKTEKKGEGSEKGGTCRQRERLNVVVTHR
jgi:hypothetical protein